MTTTQTPTALDALAENAREMDELAARRWEAMHQARQAGISWTRIGAALGMSKQAAQSWYRRNAFKYDCTKYDTPAAPAAPAPALSDRIRATYAELAAQPAAWVSLTRLRAALPEVPRADLDAELFEMVLEPGVMLDPEFNQKTLTEADRAAAIRMGGENCHLLAIGRH